MKQIFSIALFCFVVTILLGACHFPPSSPDPAIQFEKALSLVEQSTWAGNFLYTKGQLIEVENSEIGIRLELEIEQLSRNIYPDPGNDEHDWYFWKPVEVHGRIYWIYVCSICSDQYWVNTGQPASLTLPPEYDSLMSSTLMSIHWTTFLEAPVIRLSSYPGTPGNWDELIYSAEPLGTAPWSDASRSSIIGEECPMGGAHHWKFVGYQTYSIPEGGFAPFAVFYCEKCGDYYLINMS